MDRLGFLCRSVRGRLQEISFLLTAFAFCAICQVADVVSSLGASPGSDVYETNPFSRHADGSFWPLHGIVVKVYLLAVFLLMSAFVYYSLRRINRRVARVASAGPLIYFGLICWYAAAENILLLFHIGRFNSWINLL